MHVMTMSYTDFKRMVTGTGVPRAAGAYPPGAAGAYPQGQNPAGSPGQFGAGGALTGANTGRAPATAAANPPGTPGPLPEPAAPVAPVSLTATAATPAGSITLHFSSVPPTVTENMVVTGANIPPGAKVKSKTADTVVMTVPATGPGVVVGGGAILFTMDDPQRRARPDEGQYQPTLTRRDGPAGDGRRDPANPAATGKKLSGTVYEWGGTPASGQWGTAFVSDDWQLMLRAGSLSHDTAPLTFAADFPDAVQLDGPLNVA